MSNDNRLMNSIIILIDNESKKIIFFINKLEVIIMDLMFQKMKI